MLRHRLKWPLLALALALVAAIAAAALDLGQAPPDPAEAQGRAFDDITLEYDRMFDATHPAEAVAAGEQAPPMRPGPCVVDISGVDQSGDILCISRKEGARVTLTSPDSTVPYRAYVTGGRSGMGNAFHAGVQADSGHTRDDAAFAYLGRPGLVEHNGRLAQGSSRHIDLTRDMATHGCSMFGQVHKHLWNCSTAYVFIHTGAAGAALSTLPQKVTSAGELADMSGDGSRGGPDSGPDMMVRLYFMPEFIIESTWFYVPGVYYDENGNFYRHPWRQGAKDNPDPLAHISYGGGYHPRPGWTFKPYLDRRVDLTGRWNPNDTSNANKSGIKFCVMPRDYNNGGYWHPDGMLTARLDFAPGANLLAGADNYWEATQETPTSNLQGRCNFLYLTGFDPAGPMRGELNFTYEDGVGGAHRMQPITVYVKGPATALNIMETSVRSSNDGGRSVRVRYEVADAMGHVLESDDHLQNRNGTLKATGNLASATWRAADAATRSALGGSGSGRDGLLVIPVKDDAPAGTYTLNITASANRNLKGNVSFEVPAAREPAPRPGQPARPAAVSVAVAASSDLTAGGRAEFTYTLSDAGGNPLAASAHPVTWEAGNAATTAIIDTAGSVDPARQSDGAFGFDLADNAVPGEYRVNVQTVATSGGNALASGSVSFSIKGGPAAYAVTGPDTVAPGGYAVYQVTVTDANGATPTLTAEQRAVTIAVSGSGAGSARLFNPVGGRVALDAEGVGRFRLRANLAAAEGSVITLTATGVAGATAGTKSVTVETAATAP